MAVFRQLRYNNGVTEGVKYTSGQVPRGARPDADVFGRMYFVFDQVCLDAEGNLSD